MAALDKTLCLSEKNDPWTELIWGYNIKTEHDFTPNRIMILQVSWFSGRRPCFSFLEVELLLQPLSHLLAVGVHLLGVGVHLGAVRASSLTARRPRRPPRRQTWLSAQRDAPSERWTPCRDLPGRLTAAESWDKHKLLIVLTVKAAYAYNMMWQQNIKQEEGPHLL